jgi:hypothetical protein
MKLNELKDWITNLPSDFDEFTVVNGEYGIIDEEHMYRVDKPITTCIIDQETKELVLLNDTNDNVVNEN